MGFMLVHERMLESYMIARKLFLKPGGNMFPTTGTLFAAPFTDPGTCVRRQLRPGAHGGNTLTAAATGIAGRVACTCACACTTVQPCGKTSRTRWRFGRRPTSTV
jgi:hypothetical protein